MARTPRPTAVLKAEGAYRPGEHGKRLDEVVTPGLPDMPAGLTASGERVWDLVVAHLGKKALTEADGIALQSLCEWWQEYRTAQKNEAGMKPYCRLNMMVAAWRQCSDLIKRFGLTPVDRARVRVDDTPDEDDEGGGMVKLLA